MTIRSRLVVSFAAILLLFAANMVMFVWSNRARAASIEAARRAIDRQSHLASINHRVSDIQKQVTLLAQMPSDALTAEDVDQVRRQLNMVSTDIDATLAAAEPQSGRRLANFREKFIRLSHSWLTFYENLGVNPARAISELAIRAEPLAQEVIQQMLPELQKDEQESVSSATAEMYRLASLTGQVTVGIFLSTTCVALVIAYLLSRYLTRTLDALRMGAGLIGRGFFGETIKVDAKDELGELATAFNKMRMNLKSLHEELTGANEELQRRNGELNEERKKADALLLNILPNQIAEELRTRGEVEPKLYQDVSIMFTDFASFSVSTENVESRHLIRLLNEYFTAFDEIVDRYNLEKLKTIGDSYMCAGGIPPGGESHVVDCILAGLEMLQFVLDRVGRCYDDLNWDIRIGIHTGPVIAGVVGIRKFAFDLWGASVNFSSRMESSGVSNRINISEDTYNRVKDFFECEYRGKVMTKDRKAADMYLVSGILPELMSAEGEYPPAPFARRYQQRFGRPLPAFPPQPAPAALPWIK